MKKVAEKFVFLEYFLYLCTINKIRIKYIRDIMINFSKFNSLYSVANYFVYKIEDDGELIGMLSGVKLNEFVVDDYVWMKHTL